MLSLFNFCIKVFVQIDTFKCTQYIYCVRALCTLTPYLLVLCMYVYSVHVHSNAPYILVLKIMLLYKVKGETTNLLFFYNDYHITLLPTMIWLKTKITGH